jgi:large repetitive protein
VNQPPTVNAPASASVKQNGTFKFSSGSVISVADTVAAGNAEQVTLHDLHGKLTLASTSGLAFISGSNKSASMTLRGTLANLNHALNGLVYTPTSGYFGADSLTISVSDTVDGLTSPTATVAVTVGKAPTISSAKTATFSVGNAGSFTVTTTGFPSATFTESGALPSGVTFNMSTGVLSGTPNPGSGGTYHLKFTASNGFGAAASQNFTLTVNQAPTVNVPPTIAINQNTPIVFSAANGNAISVVDVNAGSNAERLTLTVANGTIKLGSTNGVHFVSGANKSSSMTLSGTVAALNAALNGLTFTPTSGYVGAASIAVSMEDMGNGLTSPSNVAVTVNAVNLAEVGPSVTGFGDNGGPASGTINGSPADFAVSWAGLAAAVEHLYT